MTPFDDELRGRFGQLRHGDVVRAPRIADLAARTPRDRRATNARRAAIALAACIVIVGGVVGRRVLLDRAPAPPAANWQSPTTSLVPTAGRPVLAPAPLLSSILDGATTSTLWKKGD